MAPKPNVCWEAQSKNDFEFIRMIQRFEPGKLLDFFKYFDPENQFHLDAVTLLQEECEALDPDVMSDFASWVRMFRSTTTPGVSLKFTPQLFENLTGYPANRFSADFCHDCAFLFDVTGFSDHRDASRMLMANLMHETGRFRWLKEIASGDAYENRQDLGNTQPGDGRRFKGAGVIMLTGRYGYTKLYNFLKDTEGVDDPKILTVGCNHVAERYPFTSAISWIKDNNLLDICISEGFDSCCYRINGGWNGYQDRLEMLARCQEFMV